MRITEELRSLFNTVRVKLGAPIRRVELDDNQLCTLLDSVVGDYASTVQNWIISNNWLSMLGKNQQSFITNPQEMAFAFSMRSLDFSKDYSQWFSKEVGLQQRGSYELKKDFFIIEKGKQCYLIPKGREINKVLYITPSTTRAALYGNIGTLDAGLAGGFGQLGNMGNGMGLTGFYVGSAYDTFLLAADLKTKNSLLRGDLSYKVTAGPDGTHIVHLLSTPGSHQSLKGMAVDDSWGWGKYHNCVCWYTYYDVSTDEDAEKCRLENKDNVLLTPDQVPLDKMHYELMNYPTQQTIKQLLIAEAMITVGLIRGYASGTISIPQAQMQLDYSMLLEMGKTEKERVMTELKERLENMTPWKQMENYATMSNQLMEILKNKPLGGFYVI